MSRHIVLTTFGSLGDLHPCLAIGRSLVGRGHCTVEAVAGVLARLIDDRSILARAREVGEEVRATHGADRAAEEILKSADNG